MKQLSRVFTAHATRWMPWLIVVFYLVTHLYRLTLLPVFADEAIYIRWSQLIIDDWQQYLFFPLNDGKTPLQIWMSVPLQLVFSNQLFAGRVVAVLAGLVQVMAVGQIIKLLGGRPKTVWLGMILTSILPFWFFHHRMALLDAWLTTFASLAIYGAISIAQLPRPKSLTLRSVLSEQRLKAIILTGTMFGLAVLTKIPALLFAPILMLFALLPSKAAVKDRGIIALSIGTSLVIGLILFALLKLHPAFGQLFSRGNDFLYPWQEVVFNGVWQQTVISFPNYVNYFLSYLTTPVVLLALTGLFLPTNRRVHHLLFWSALLFAGPIALLGIVVFPRYLFPAALFLTVSAALSVQGLVDTYISQAKLLKKSVLSLLLASLLALTFASSSLFIVTAVTDPAQMPLVSADKEQYLYEWSSGHGVIEALELIRDLSKHQRLAVATEGSFGTLPDGLLMYLHRTDVSNLYVEGIGFPVLGIPDTFADRAQEFDQTLLVINSHRLEFEIPKNQLLTQFCRPDNAPCLQVWDITAVVK